MYPHSCFDFVFGASAGNANTKGYATEVRHEKQPLRGTESLLQADNRTSFRSIHSTGIGSSAAKNPLIDTGSLSTLPAGKTGQEIPAVDMSALGSNDDSSAT